MKFSLIIIILVSLTTLETFGQESKQSAKDADENSATDLNKRIDELQHNYEKSEIKREDFEEKTASDLGNLEEKMTTKIEAVDSKYGYYLIFGGSLIAIIVFAVNFFGRKIIKDRVEALIQQTASGYAEQKTNKMIEEYLVQGNVEKIINEKGKPEIDKLLSELERKGSVTIQGIQQKGEKAISSLVATLKQGSSDSGAETDQEIETVNTSNRIQEFFDLAFGSSDALVQIELYNSVLKLDPEHKEALNNIGLAFNNAYSYEKATEYFNKCIAKYPKFPLPYVNLANSLIHLGKLEDALTNVNRAVALNPKLDGSYSVKGSILTRMGKMKEAEQTFGEAISLNPKSPEAYLNRGFFYEETNKFKESEADYLMAEKLDFQNKAMLYNNFAVLYRRQKDFDKAQHYLEKARKENPNFPNIDGTLALIYADKGDKENFYKYLIVALEKGCPAWNYLNDSGFDPFRNDEKLKTLLESYKKKQMA
ncbi:MAG: tetratricopeptide repeat protein [Cyclobacteriaceae bacterium]